MKKLQKEAKDIWKKLPKCKDFKYKAKRNKITLFVGRIPPFYFSF